MACLELHAGNRLHLRGRQPLPTKTRVLIFMFHSGYCHYLLCLFFASVSQEVFSLQRIKSSLDSLLPHPPFLIKRNCLKVLGLFGQKKRKKSKKKKKAPMLGECCVFLADNKGLNRHAQSRKTVVITAKQ